MTLILLLAVAVLVYLLAAPRLGLPIVRITRGRSPDRPGVPPQPPGWFDGGYAGGSAEAHVEAVVPYEDEAYDRVRGEDPAKEWEQRWRAGRTSSSEAHPTPAPPGGGAGARVWSKLGEVLNGKQSTHDLEHVVARAADGWLRDGGHRVSRRSARQGAPTVRVCLGSDDWHLVVDPRTGLDLRSALEGEIRERILAVAQERGVDVDAAALQVQVHRSPSEDDDRTRVDFAFDDPTLDQPHASRRRPSAPAWEDDVTPEVLRPWTVTITYVEPGARLGGDAPTPTGRTLPLAGRIEVGRSVFCDLPVPGTYISRKHGVLTTAVVDGRAELHFTDTSKHGSAVNGEDLDTGETRVLSDGDTISLGGCSVLRVQAH